jgi:hypothetical protein
MAYPSHGPKTKLPARLDAVADPRPEPEDHPASDGSSAPRGACALSRFRAAFDWLFRSRQTGRITVVQIPNVALSIFLVTVVLRWVVPTGTWVRTAVNWISVVALGVWALDEVVRGVNPWRRMLGLGIGGLVVAGAVSMAR